LHAAAPTAPSPLALHDALPTSEAEQRLAQALPRLAVAGVGPQERGQLLAAVLPSRRQPEVREEGLRLAGRQGEGRTRADAGLETTEQREAEAHHGTLSRE